MDSVIVTERMTLGPVVAHDLDDLVALDADPQVMRYITGGRPSSRSEVQARVDMATSWTWVARAIDDGRFLGWFSARPSADGGREIGVRLRSEEWGKGLATEGARAVVDRSFAALGATRVWAQTMTVNWGSRRVMEHAGLRYLRTFFEDWGEVIEGSDQGDVEYELTRAEWSRGLG